MNNRERVGLRAICGTVVAVVGLSAAAAPVVDIDTLSPTNVPLGGAQVNCCGGSANTVAVVVDAAVAGLLTRVDLQIGAQSAGYRVLMHLLPTVAGLPVADLAAAHAVFAVDVPAWGWAQGVTYSWLSVDVQSAALRLGVGDDYAIVLTQPSAGPSPVVGWAYSSAPSSRLTVFDRSGSTQSWDPCVLGLGCGIDVAVRTFVDPAATPAIVTEPASWALTGGALLAAAAAIRRRRQALPSASPTARQGVPS